MKKTIKILLWIVGIVLALILLLSLLAGPVAKGVVNHNGEKLVGRQMHLDHASLNLFNGHLTLRGLQLYEDDGTTAFASLDTLDVRARLLHLMGKKVDIRSVVLAGLEVNVTQEGEHFNFSTMIDHFRSDPEKEKDTTPSDWMVRLGDIRINHAHAAYHDLLRDKEWRIADLNLRVPGFAFGGKESTQAGLNLELDDGGRLNLNTKYDAASNDFVAAVNLTGFALANIKEYIEDNLAITGLAGTIDAYINASGNLSEVMQSHFSGTVEVDNLDVADATGATVAKMEHLSVGITDINIDAHRFALDNITIDGLAAAFEQWDDGNTVSRMIKKKVHPDAKKEEHQLAANTKPMLLKVGQVKVADCQLAYTDHTLVEPFTFTISKLAIDATNVSTTGTNNARLHASLPSGGTLALRWQGNINQWTAFQDAALTIKGLDIKHLNPLIVTYTGYPMDDGIFGLNSHLAINNAKLENTNTIDIYKATVGQRLKDIEPKQKIPLRAALYVLKDKDEKILIDMPVQGNVADPEFKYMKVVWKTLGNLLVKVATSPARAIAAAMGNGDENLDFIDVAPNQKQLTSEQYHTLATLASVAKADTLLSLNFELHTTDTTHADRLNKNILNYMAEQGIGNDRVSVTTGNSPTEGQPTGYSVTSELKID